MACVPSGIRLRRYHARADWSCRVRLHLVCRPAVHTTVTQVSERGCHERLDACFCSQWRKHLQWRKHPQLGRHPHSHPPTHPPTCILRAGQRWMCRLRLWRLSAVSLIPRRAAASLEGRWYHCSTSVQHDIMACMHFNSFTCMQRYGLDWIGYYMPAGH